MNFVKPQNGNSKIRRISLRLGEMTLPEYLEEFSINQKKWRVGDLVVDALRQRKSEPRVRREKKYALLSTRNLGFESNTCDKDTYLRAVELGYGLCDSREDGPALRFQYLDQPLGEWVRVAMKNPYVAQDRGKKIYIIGHPKATGEKWIDMRNFNPKILRPPDTLFLFLDREEH